jgi:DnaJ-class molecular chaperone
MAEDPYDTLGVKRDATPEQIRAAYRKLAKKHHPDLNPGDKKAEARFKDISAANELLSDAEKRARFDRGEIDAAGQERPERNFYRNYAEGEAGRRYTGQPGGFEEAELGDILSELFGQRMRGGGSGAGVRMRGQDIRYSLDVAFLDTVTGATRRLALPDGKDLDVRIPPGVTDGQVLRLRGQGGAGLSGGEAGDALIEIHILPHRHFRRDGRDLLLDLPVTLHEAVLGGRIEVPTPAGAVAMTVPAGSDTGSKLRLRGRGIAASGGQTAGDLIVTLRVVLGTADPALESFLRDHPAPADADPRRQIMEGT